MASSLVMPPRTEVVGATPPFRLDPQARCRGLENPDVMYPVHGSGVAAAKKICRRCPLKPECAAWAIEKKEEWGVWGGLSEKERRDMRRRGTAVSR